MQDGQGQTPQDWQDDETSPGYGYCASQGSYCYGYKLDAVCGLSGVIHSYDLTKAAVHESTILIMM